MITVEQLKTYLGVSGTSEDSLLELLKNSAENIVTNYIGRNLLADDYEELINGNAQKEIILENYPLNTAVVYYYNSDEQWEEIESSMIKKSGRILLYSPMIRGYNNYKVVYNAGYTETPADIVMATIKIASRYYNTRTSDGVKSESVNGDSISYDISEIPYDVMVILNSYRNV